MSRELLLSGDIRAIRLVSGLGLAYQAGVGEPPKLSAQDEAALRQVLSSGETAAYLEGDLLKVIEPVRSSSGAQTSIGAVMVYLPTNAWQAAVRSQLMTALFVALGVLLAGGAGGVFLARLVTRPLKSLSAAAEEVAQGHYFPRTLAPVLARRDELGRLGQVFDSMAREVSARDRRLSLLKTIIPLGVSLSAERDFNRLLETLLAEAQRITRAKAGSLYLRRGAELQFVIVRNQPLHLHLGGSSGNPVTFPPVPLRLADGFRPIIRIWRRTPL